MRSNHFGRRAIVVRADAANEADVNAMFDRVEADLGPVQILTVNAGIDPVTPIADMDPAEWRRVIDVNLTGPFLCTHRAVARMESGASIINITSIHDSTPRIGSSHYSASKAGVVMLTKTAALELGPRNIRVNATAPGAIETDINRERSSRSAPMRGSADSARAGRASSGNRRTGGVPRVRCRLVHHRRRHLRRWRLFSRSSATERDKPIKVFRWTAERCVRLTVHHGSTPQSWNAT
ncbi:MAG: SDR family NAD(P)-dependent oxidoreductase [Thermomicrobiales bacterium]